MISGRYLILGSRDYRGYRGEYTKLSLHIDILGIINNHLIVWKNMGIYS
jgi:hypothetical protein